MEEQKTCQCDSSHRKDGFTSVVQPDGSLWWVCSRCRLPTGPWLNAMLKATQRTEAQS
jgi:hypothetical protein